MDSVQFIRRDRDRCAVCWASTELHEYDGEQYCSEHLAQRLGRETTGHAPRPPGGFEYLQRRRCIGLDT